MKIAVVFPGQGSQYIRMGKDFIERNKKAQDMLMYAGKVINSDLKEYLYKGETASNKGSQLSQIAVVLIELIIYESMKDRLEELGLSITLFAGHSLGEYAALYASGNFSFDEVVKLVTERTKVMNEDNSSVKTGMTAFSGLPIEQMKQQIESYQLNSVFLSNINSYKQIVYSGEVSNLDILENKMGEILSTTRLKVSKGYHSPFMKNAKDRFKKSIDEFTFSQRKETEIGEKIISNINGDYYKNFHDIITSLSSQFVSQVNWIAVVERLIKSEVTHIIELGPGRVLTGLNKNILSYNKIKNIRLLNIEDTVDLENVMMELKQ